MSIVLPSRKDGVHQASHAELENLLTSGQRRMDAEMNAEGTPIKTYVFTGDRPPTIGADGGHLIAVDPDHPVLECDRITKRRYAYRGKSGHLWLYPEARCPLPFGVSTATKLEHQLALHHFLQNQLFIGNSMRRALLEKFLRDAMNKAFDTDTLQLNDLVVQLMADLANAYGRETVPLGAFYYLLQSRFDGRCLDYMRQLISTVPEDYAEVPTQVAVIAGQVRRQLMLDLRKLNTKLMKSDPDEIRNLVALLSTILEFEEGKDHTDLKAMEGLANELTDAATKCALANVKFAGRDRYEERHTANVGDVCTWYQVDADVKGMSKWVPTKLVPRIDVALTNPDEPLMAWWRDKERAAAVAVAGDKDERAAIISSTLGTNRTLAQIMAKQDDMEVPTSRSSRGDGPRAVVLGRDGVAGRGASEELARAAVGRGAQRAARGARQAARSHAIHATLRKNTPSLA